jgi:protein SCO1/2
MRCRRPAANASIAALGAILAVALGASCGSSKNQAAAIDNRAEGASASGFAGAALPLARARDFTLADERGGVASSREYRGRTVVLAFLGTRCGAPCAVIAQQIRGALDALPARVPVLLVSVDPAADTARAIARLLARSSLTRRARYLVGPAASLRAVWSSYRVPAPARGSAVFGRFAPVVLLDGDGRARVEYALEGLTPESLAHDIRALSR